MAPSLPFSASALKQQLVLLLIAGITFFGNLGGGRLMDRDEPRNAGCAMEMLERGDWVVPTFNTQLRTHKPVLTYWLMMSAYQVLGVNEFAARFWSALLGVGTVMMTYHIGRRLFGGVVGFWGGLVTATSLWFAIAARIATPDSALIFFATLPILLFVLAVFPPAPTEEGHATWHQRGAAALESSVPRQWWVAALMYGAMGLAVLAKGPVGLVLPTAVIGMFLLIVRLPGPAATPTAGADGAWGEPPPPIAHRLGRAAIALLRPLEPRHFLRTCWAMRPITAILVALAVSLPWYMAVHLRTDGQFTRGFFLEHNLGRAMNTMESHGGLFVLYYPLVTCIAFFPWSVFLLAMFAELALLLRRGGPGRPGLTFVACWVGVYVGVFSMARTQLPSYVTPMYPAMGLIAGVYLHRMMQGRQLVRRWLAPLGYALFALAGIGVAIAAPPAAGRYLPGAQGLAAMGAIPFLGGGAALLLYRKGWPAASVRVFAVAAVLTTFTALALALHRIDHDHQKSHELLAAIHGNTPPGLEPRIYALGVLEPSWVFYARQPIAELDDVPALSAGLKEPGGFVITQRSTYELVKRDLPAGVVVLHQIPYYMAPQKGDLVVLGRRWDASAETKGEALHRQ
jgi:4-amino-4-deoxy-L-arabinose transferase-like glycosyltransferase